MKSTQSWLRRIALVVAVAAVCWGSSQGITAQTQDTPKAKGTPEEQAQKMKRMTTAERKEAAARARAARAAAAAKKDKKATSTSGTPGSSPEGGLQ